MAVSPIYGELDRSALVTVPYRPVMAQRLETSREEIVKLRFYQQCYRITGQNIFLTDGPRPSFNVDLVSFEVMNKYNRKKIIKKGKIKKIKKEMSRSSIQNKQIISSSIYTT